MKHDSHVPELLTVTGLKDSSGIQAAAETNASLILDGTTKQINKVLYVLCVSCTFYSGCCNATSLQPLTATYLQLKQLPFGSKETDVFTGQKFLPFSSGT